MCCSGLCLELCPDWSCTRQRPRPVRAGRALARRMIGLAARLQRSRPQFLQKRFATRRQPFLEPCRTIAIAAGPGLAPVFVTTIAPRMRVFHRQEIKIFFPIGTLFLKGRITKTSFYPTRLALGIHARHLHVVQVLVSSD